MKCEHCGKNEVTFVYKSSINGKTEEKHLCGECAQALGYMQKVFSRQSVFEDFLGRNSLLGKSFHEDLFAPMSGLMGRLMENPFDDFFADMPALRLVPAMEKEPAAREKTDELVDKEDQDRFSTMRQLNALRIEMKQAIGDENFERAAVLRDQIRELESKNAENNQQM